jgi:ABC-2 type transport system permease protein
MKTLPFLLKKEFLQILRNKTLIRLIIVLPLFQLTILPWAATFDQRNIPLCVVDNDNTGYSRKLTDKITASGFFRLADYSRSHTKALKDLENGKSNLILNIPPHFEKDLVNGHSPKLMVSLNALNGQEAGLGLSYISQIINNFSKQLNSKEKMPVSVSTIPSYRFNPEMNYHNYMVPGIIVLLVSILGGMMSAINIVSEKEIGTIEQINVTPVSKLNFILGKLIPFWVIGLTLLTFGMFIAWLIYGLIPAGSIVNIYIFGFFYLLAFTGLGLLISNFAKTQQQAMFMILFFLINFILISGLFTPISSMPDWAQNITYINPIRYFVEVMRLIYLKGSGFTDILPHLLKIIGFVVVINTFAVISYRKTDG